MTYGLFRLLLRAIRAIPPSVLYAFARFLGLLFWHCSASRRRMATAAVQKHLNLPADESRRIARQSFKENFHSFFEIFHVADFFIKTSVEACYSPETVAMLQAENAPIVIATAHLGSWELMPGLAPDTVPERESMVIVRSRRSSSIDRIMAEMRGARGMLVVPHRQASSVVLPKLRAGGVASFLVDHNCSRKEAVFLPFFNDTAAVNVGPAGMALRTKASVYPVFLLRNGKGKHILHILPPLQTTNLSGSINERLRKISRFYTNAVEALVRQYPEQWFWMHQRWKTREKKEPEN